MTLERERLVRLQQDRDALEIAFERRTAALSDSEQRLRFVLKAGRMGTCTVDLQSGYTVASDGCKAIFGRRAEEDFQYADLLAMIHPDDLGRMQATLAASVADKADYEIEYRVNMPSGEVRWVEVRATLLRGGRHAAQHVCASPSTSPSANGWRSTGRCWPWRSSSTGSRTRWRRCSPSRTRLTRAASLADGAGRSTRAAVALERARHADPESWAGASLGEVAEKALSAFQSGSSRFLIDGPEVWLPPRLALALTMALHELATNAVKYGALSRDGGH